MDLYEGIQNNQEKTNKENFAMFFVHNWENFTNATITTP